MIEGVILFYFIILFFGPSSLEGVCGIIGLSRSVVGMSRAHLTRPPGFLFIFIYLLSHVTSPIYRTRSFMSELLQTLCNAIIAGKRR